MVKHAMPRTFQFSESSAFSVIRFDIFTCMLGKNNIRYDGADWIHLAKERDQW
jgi:hypothetical protein